MRTTLDTRPNILLIITDHQAFFAHDQAGELEYRHRRFERFANEGIRFDRAYTACPLCGPARGSMLTGVYPSIHGLIRNTCRGKPDDFRQNQRGQGRRDLLPQGTAHQDVNGGPG
jgi:arylsulfatase A-like enzyme